MPVYINNKTFILETDNTHYVFCVDETGNTHHLHFGKKCDNEDYSFYLIPEENSNHPQRDLFREEFSFFGGTMYREADLKVTFSDNTREADLVFDCFASSGEKLEVTLKDKYYPLKVTLIYEVFPKYDIIKRSVSLKNEGEGEIKIERAFSAQITLPSKKPYKIINTNGAWGAEFLKTETQLSGGEIVFDSKKGTASHIMSPYFIAHQNCEENFGEAYFASLMYSGSFKVLLERDTYGVTRAHLGLNDFDFEYVLGENDILELPCVILGYTDKGFGQMSRNINRYCLNCVFPENFREKELPVLYNSWEATYFDVSAKGQSELAEKAAQIGAELFVMDDGWFGERGDDTKALGDWYVNPEKFPNGLSELIDNVNKLGLDFGLWIEPEMVCPDSDLFRAHPNWAYHYEHREAHTLRSQLVLNLTRSDVQSFVYNTLDSLLSQYNIKYIKWDMNRPFSETGAENLPCPKSLWYLHTKAVYNIVDRLKAKHKDVQFESCSSGGGRCDLGAISHFDEVWTSDNTDAIDRMTIQNGFTLMHPVKAMRAWVTDIEGYNKPTSLDFRFNIAMQGSLGIGGNLLKYSEEELSAAAKNIALYKEIRRLVQFGDLYRICDFDKDEVSANLYVNTEKTQAVLFIAAKGTRFFKKALTLSLFGLDEKSKYAFSFEGREYVKSGAYLKNVGIEAIIRGTDYCKVIKIKKV